MREIKFRAWDGKKMLLPDYCDDSDFYISCDGTLRKIAHDSYNEWQESAKGLTLMQFTGLTDKNGKEIYEGDVVEYQYMSGFECSDDDYQKLGVGSRGVVTFVDGEFTPREHYCEVEDGYYSWRRFNFQVIGNIYENGDLLT